MSAGWTKTLFGSTRVAGVVSVFLALSLAGCGYSATRLLPAEYQVIYIEPIQNRIPIAQETSEWTGFISNIPKLEEDVTQGLYERFLFDGNLRVTSERSTADLILYGELKDFYRQPIRRLNDESVEEYRLNLVAALTLRDAKGELVLEEPALIADTTYFVQGSAAVAESTAVNDLVVDFSRRVVEWVVEYW